MTLEMLEKAVASCTECGLHTGRVCPVVHKGNYLSNVMICGMAPAKTENDVGVPFIGPSGKLLDKMLEDSDLTGKVYITNLVKCFLAPGESLNKDSIDNCKHFLEDQIRMIRPKVVITLGADVSFALIRSDSSTLGDIRGRVFKEDKVSIIPTYHPSYLRRFGGTGSDEYTNSIADFNMARELAYES